jgi:tetratricopeptide (TPR) repeat protein
VDFRCGSIRLSVGELTMPEKSLQSVPRPFREQFEKGIAAIHRNNLDYAIAIFNQVLLKEPAFYECREALRAAQLKKAGGKGGFLKRFLGTASSSPLLARGQLALRNNPIEALEIAEQILNGDPNNAPAHRLLADAALAADLPRTAALSLELVFKLSPDRDVAIKLGHALAQAGEVERAENILGELSATLPGDVEVSKALKNVSARRTLSEGGYEALGGGEGSYRDILKDKAEAVALEQEKREVKTDELIRRQLAENEARIAREPQNLRLLRSTAELHTQQKDFDKALEYYDRILRSAGATDPSLERAIAETRLRQFDHRISLLDPRAPDQADQAARLKAERDAYELEECRQRLDKYPNDLQIRFDLGVLCFRAGKWNEAIQEFQKAQNNPHKRTPALGYLGKCFARRGMFDLAARQFQKAVAEKPVFDDEKKDLIYELGSALEKMGKAGDALEQFKLIYEVDNNYRDVGAKMDAYYSGQ